MPSTLTRPVRTTLGEAGRWASELVPFDANGTLRGYPFPPRSTGRMSESTRAQYLTVRPRIVYTIVSYSTPIVWVLDSGEVIVNPDRYTVTTSRHRSALWRLTSQAAVRRSGER